MHLAGTSKFKSLTIFSSAGLSGTGIQPGCFILHSDEVNVVDNYNLLF